MQVHSFSYGDTWKTTGTNQAPSPPCFISFSADPATSTNVKLKAIDPSRVLMTWDLPTISNVRILKCLISWRLDGEVQTLINLPPVSNYTFTNLKAGQTVMAAVSTDTLTFDKFWRHKLNPFSPYYKATTPHFDNGESFLLVLSHAEPLSKIG